MTRHHVIRDRVSEPAPLIIGEGLDVDRAHEPNAP